MAGTSAGAKKGWTVRRHSSSGLKKAPRAISSAIKSYHTTGKKVRNGLYEYKGHSLEKVSTKEGFGFNGWLVSKNSNPRDANVYSTRQEAMKALKGRRK